MPNSLALTKLVNLSNVAVATMDLPINAQGCYDNVVTIQRFMPTFKLAGGINLPKIIECLGSDGVARKQLVKVHFWHIHVQYIKFRTIQCHLLRIAQTCRLWRGLAWRCRVAMTCVKTPSCSRCLEWSTICWVKRMRLESASCPCDSTRWCVNMYAGVIMLDDVMLFNKAHHAILLSMYSRFIITIVSIATRWYHCRSAAEC